MQVANMTFLVRKLGEDCAPLQYIRELTQNAIEGICQLNGEPGQITWDLDWTSHELLDGVFKLSCIDKLGLLLVTLLGRARKVTSPEAAPRSLSRGN